MDSPAVDSEDFDIELRFGCKKLGIATVTTNATAHHGLCSFIELISMESQNWLIS